MRIQFQIKEKMIPIFEIEKNHDILIVGGIEIFIKSILNIPHISLVVNGIGTKIAIHLKKIGLYPVIFDFLGNDEFLELINRYFEQNEINLFFSRQPYGTKRVLKILDKGEELVYKDFRNIEKLDYNSSINILADIYKEVKSVYLILQNWDTNIVRNIKLMGKFLFLDFEESLIVPEKKEIFGDFIFTNENIKLTDNIHYLYKVTFKKDGKIKFEFSEESWEIIPFSQKKEFLFEAKCAFKSIVISSLFDGKSLKDVLLLGNIAYSYALENKGKMISKIQLFEEYYKLK
ncbi:hypothetical protein X275_07890 [Marinitoga sp. 1197]|uniref:hypothetical protein n=1 Tax=unclassified Marinitoga TaxID=2640159 RepID=UPI0006413983|nr:MULTISPECIES: hypothetical protein [unclassified Marinitoga]KLO21843.1 hypothetical protein X275_07890 [Marinitoga sp. 1197]KLO22939.1 hypothetical protein X274_07355 [Marinitoga sp. 1155]NUU99453.1 hypothetical protein [Marinitoga sp. 1154]